MWSRQKALGWSSTDVSRENTWVIELWAELVSGNTIFSPERTMDKLWLCRFGVLADIFLKKNAICHSRQQLTVYAANDKIQVYKQKLKTLKTGSTNYEICQHFEGPCNSADRCFFFKWLVHDVRKSYMSKMYIQSVSYLIPVRMAITKKEITVFRRMWRKGGNVNWYSNYENQQGGSSEKLKIELL